MPKYDFRCGACSAVIELSAPITEPIPTALCTSCMIPMQRDYTNEAIGFIPINGMYARDTRK
jgi:predicted nucleic acid-binding Zn ribbon protein